jgi:uncharacterized protein
VGFVPALIDMTGPIAPLVGAVSSPVLSLGGLLVGVVVGMTGMGGGALLTPLLVLGFGIPARAAVSSDLVVSLLMKPAGAVAHHQLGSIRRDLVLRLAMGSIPAAFCGAALVNLVAADRTNEFSEQAIGVALLIASSVFIVRTLRKTRSANEQPELRPFVTLLIGIAGGFIVGATSVGSGSLMMVLLTWAYPTLAAKTLIGTDLAQAVPLVASAVLAHLFFGEIRIALVVPLLIGAIPGAWIGGHLTHRIPERIMRPVLAVVLATSGLKLLRFI